MASIYPEETLEKIRARLDPLTVLKAIGYRLDTVQEAVSGLKIFCPIHREAVFRTLNIESRTRRYRCSYSLCGGSKGGDLIDLFAQANKIEYDEAVRRLVQRMNISIELPLTGDSLQQMLDGAENALVQGTFDAALEQFNRILSTHPDHWAALVGVLEIHRARKEDAKKLKVLSRLVDLARQQGKTTEAAEYCREILEQQPSDVAVRLNYAECLVAQKKLNEALDEYMRLADAFETRKEFDRALEMYRKIEDLNLDIVDVYPHILQLMVASARTREAVEETMRKASQHEARGEYDRALACYRYVLEIEDGQPEAREKFIETSILAGLNEARIEECLSLIEDAQRGESYPRAMRAVEQLCAAAPDHLGVQGKYVELLRRTGGEAAATEAQIELICRLMDQGRLDEAESNLRRFGSAANLSLESLKRLAAAQRRVGLNSQAAEVYAAIAEILARENRLEEAAEACDEAIGLKPDETGYRQRQIELHRSLGRNGPAREQCVALAERALAGQRWEEAERFVRQGLEIAPDDPRLMEDEARVLEALGRPEEARSRYVEGARRHVASQQWEAARALLQRILASDPNQVEAALLMADVARGQGEPRAGLEALQRLAAQAMAQKDYGTAKKLWVKMDEIAPDDPLILVEMSTAQARLGETTELLETHRRLVAAYVAAEAWPKALEYCTAVLDREPENVWVLEQMIKASEKTDRKRTVPELCRRLAQLYEKQSDADRAQEYYERALAGDPANLDARIGYVKFLAGLHRYEAASNQAQTVVAALAAQRRHDEAISLVEGLIERAPDDLALRQSLMDLCREAGREREYVIQCTQLINLHYRRNEFPEVAGLYRRLLEREPDNVTFRTHLIDALMRLRRRDEAIEQYFQLADRYLRHENHEDAENTLNELLNQSPGNPRALEMLLDIQIESGRTEPAIQRARELSEIHVGAGRNERAVEVLRRVLALDPNNREIIQWISEIARQDQRLLQSVEEMAMRAESQWQQGHRESAVESQIQAVRSYPDGTTHRRRLAEMLDQVGQDVASLDERVEVARIRAERGQYAEAFQTLETVLTRAPDHYGARRLRAELYARTGDQGRALEEFMKLRPESPLPAPLKGSRAETAAEGQPLHAPLEFTFDSFVVGDHNRFAHATALAVAKAPAIHYNPLFLYSDVGLGKTHLASAIANYIAEHQPQLRVVYTIADEFTNELVAAIQNNTISQFQNQYRAADVLLVDDIQFLAGKERAQDEFFHIFNALVQAKRQIIITSDRPPREIAHLEKRLKSRFGSGVIVDIQAPDLETRAAILKKDLERFENVEMDNRLITLIAERITSNVRDLKGVLNQIRAKHELSGAEITEDLVRQVLDVYSEGP